MSLLSGSNCSCPLSEELMDIPLELCNEDFGQMQRAGVIRRVSDKVRNHIPYADKEKLTAWAELTEGLKGKKMVLTPFFQSPETDPGAPITEGGGNDSLNGIEEIVGREPTSFTGIFKKTSQKSIKAMKSLECEKSLAIFPIFGDGTIGALVDNIEEPTKVYPIPIESFFVSDKGFGGFDAGDFNNVQWSFPPNWSDNLIKIKPEFNPLEDLDV